MKKLIKKLLFLLLSLLFVSCGGSSSGKTSSFSEANNSPEVSGDGIYYVKENTREAFKIEAKDASRIKYSLSGGDFFDMYIDQHLGKVFFREPTKFSKKSVYKFNIIIEDIVGHSTTQAVTIYVKENEFENEIIEEVNSNEPLSNSEEDKYFITVWKTDNKGTSNDNQIHIPTSGDGYNYSVDWGDGTSTENISADIIHTYAHPGTYEVKLSGDFPFLAFGTTTDFNVSTVDNDSRKLLDVKQWGKIKWTNMFAAFSECVNLTGTATDAPDLRQVEMLSNMFNYAEKFNGKISDWDLSSVKYMSYMFLHASSFNQDLSKWDVSHVTSLSYVFSSASSFNQDISAWDTSNVTNMKGVFESARAFNKPLNSWDTSTVTDMSYAFAGATSFNKNINGWDTSSVTDMSAMFAFADNFNQPLNSWDVSNVENMEIMLFVAYSFNQNLDQWDVSKVKNMHSLFQDANSFNQNLENWDVSSVENMKDMFLYTYMDNRPSWYKE